MPIIKRLPFIYKSMLLSQATGSKEEVAVLRQEWCDALVIALNKAGCSMIKFGQWISMRPDMFPADLIHVHYPLPVTPSYSYGLSSSSSSSILYPCLLFFFGSFLSFAACFFFVLFLFLLLLCVFVYPRWLITTCGSKVLCSAHCMLCAPFIPFLRRHLFRTTTSYNTT